MRTKFDEQLEQLNVALITTGALCEDAISTAAKALLENDMELAKKVKPIELEIDQKEREIENLCMRLLLQQQPVAGDLRQISSALKMITDLERIGDQTSDIAELLPYLLAAWAIASGVIKCVGALVYRGFGMPFWGAQCAVGVIVLVFGLVTLFRPAVAAVAVAAIVAIVLIAQGLMAIMRGLFSSFPKH